MANEENNPEKSKRPVLKLSNPTSSPKNPIPENNSLEFGALRGAKIQNATELELSEEKRRSQRAETERDKYLHELKSIQKEKEKTSSRLDSTEQEKRALERTNVSLERTNISLGRRVKKWAAGTVLAGVAGLTAGSLGGYLTTYHLGRGHIEESVRKEESRVYASLIDKKESELNKIIEGHESRIIQLRGDIDRNNQNNEELTSRYTSELAKQIAENNATTAKLNDAQTQYKLSEAEKIKLKDSLNDARTALGELKESENKDSQDQNEISRLKDKNRMYQDILTEVEGLLVNEKNSLESKIQGMSDNPQKGADELPEYDPKNPLTLSQKVGNDLEQYGKEVGHDAGNLAISGPQAAYAGTRFLTHFPYCWKVAITGENADGDDVGLLSRTGYAFWSVLGLPFRAYEATTSHFRTVKDGAINPLPNVIAYPVNELLSPLTGENQAHRIFSVWNSESKSFVEVKFAGETIYQSDEAIRQELEELKAYKERAYEMLERVRDAQSQKGSLKNSTEEGN